MDRLLRPKVMEIETTVPNAEKQYRHWKTTFENYLEETTPVTPATPGDDASITAAATATAANERKRRPALINTVSADICELIGECATYTESTLHIFVRPAWFITGINLSRQNKIQVKQSMSTSRTSTASQDHCR